MRTAILLASFIAGLTFLMTLPACETGGSALDRPASDTPARGPLDSVTTPPYARPNPPGMPQ